MFWAKPLPRIAVALLIAVMLGGAVLLGTAAALPDTLYVNAGEELTVASMPWVHTARNTAVAAPAGRTVPDTRRSVTLAVAGIPVKTVRAVTSESRTVYVSGEPFGIKMFAEGALVVAFSDRYSALGDACPAKQAGLQLGDWIFSAGGRTIHSNEELSAAIQSLGGASVPLVCRRGDTQFTTALTPVLDKASGLYKAGVWVRDSGAGIGTLTFVDPSTGGFAGLGHAISDSDTGKELALLSGEIVPVTVTGCRQGAVGSPGELRGEFSSDTAGTVLANSEVGIYGRFTADCTALTALPVAHLQQVAAGPAEIWTTLSGRSPKAYTVTIEQVSLTGSDPNRNLLLRVTDPELLSASGGIVQGMSGSPIVQNGRLVGAVTHVLVNDPTRGYGIFAETMLEHCDAAVS